MRRRLASSLLVALVASLTLLAPVATREARADDGARIVALADTLSTSRSEKERISAVVALGRIGDKRALRPLVAALHDKVPTVRAIAAAALGRLGHRAALPALRAASTDSDELVRRRAIDAVNQISAANDLGAPPVPTLPRTGRDQRPALPRAANAARPDLFVTVKSSSDDSPGNLDRKTRRTHAGIVKQTMMATLLAERSVTCAEPEAERFGLEAHHLDLSIIKLESKLTGRYVEIEAELRLAISDDRGKMSSFLSGGAKVQVPRATYDARYLPQLRREALENAVKGLFDKLIAHMRQS